MSLKFFAILFSLCLALPLLADGKSIAKKLGLEPSSKASKQWEKIFSNPEKLKDIGADKLSPAEQSELKKYLCEHAADSDHPSIPGK
jgi:hypothetical protein